MLDKNIYACIAMGFTTVNCVQYVHAVLHRKIRPHLFSYFVWGLIMAIGCVAQIAGNAGIGAWPTAYSGLMCFTVVGLSAHYGEKNITRSDWITFVGALAAIPLWVVTKNPLDAVLLLTLIDILGFYPTFRKSHIDPWSEKILTFAIGGIVATMSTCALETYSMVTALYPVSLIVTNIGFILYLLWRRSILPAAPIK